MSDAPMQNDLQIRDYRILGQLGRGGMGSVFRALHTHLDKSVAIKVLDGRLLQDDQAIDRFRREMKAVGRLQHPNVVAALDAGEDNGTHFLVMEIVDGTDAHKILQRCGQLAIADACEIIRQAALGLQHAHENGMIHRDIKPSNLMITREGSVKILDFGLAMLHDSDGKLTEAGQAMGTIDYMAAEQIGSSHDVDIRADIYSLGATLYTLLAGQPPFSGAKYATTVKKMLAITTGNVPAITEYCDNLPNELLETMHQMLSSNPDDRPRDPSAVVALLDSYCETADLSLLLGTSTVVPDETLVLPTPDLQIPETLPGSHANSTTHQTPAVSVQRLSGWKLTALIVGLAGIALFCAALFLSTLSRQSNDTNSTPAEATTTDRKEHKLLGMLIDDRIRMLGMNAIGAPVLIPKEGGGTDEVRFLLSGLKTSEDEEEVVVGNPAVDVVKNIKANNETIIVGATLLNKNANDHSEILDTFRRYKIEIEREERSPAELERLGLWDTLSSDDRQKMTSFSDPNNRILYFFRRGNNIAIVCGYSFSSYHLENEDGSTSRGVFPCVKDRPDEVPGSLYLPVTTMFSGIVLDKGVIASADFPPNSPLNRFANSNAPDVLEYVWKQLGGQIRE